MHEKSWHVLQYKPNLHLIAERNLKRQDFETFLPLQEVTKHHFGKTNSRLIPLFPGYMFINTNNKNSSWIKINSTVGVSRLLITNNKLRPISKNIILELMGRCNDSGKLLPHRRLKSGDKIKIINTPFTEFITTIEHIDSNKRIWVLMDIMGRQSLIQLMPKQIQHY